MARSNMGKSILCGCHTWALEAQVSAPSPPPCTRWGPGLSTVNSKAVPVDSRKPLGPHPGTRTKPKPLPAAAQPNRAEQDPGRWCCCFPTAWPHLLAGGGRGFISGIFAVAQFPLLETQRIFLPPLGCFASLPLGSRGQEPSADALRQGHTQRCPQDPAAHSGAGSDYKFTLAPGQDRAQPAELWWPRVFTRGLLATVLLGCGSGQLQEPPSPARTTAASPTSPSTAEQPHSQAASLSPPRSLLRPLCPEELDLL